MPKQGRDAYTLRFPPHQRRLGESMIPGGKDGRAYRCYRCGHNYHIEAAERVPHPHSPSRLVSTPQLSLDRLSSTAVRNQGRAQNSPGRVGTTSRSEDFDPMQLLVHAATARSSLLSQKNGHSHSPCSSLSGHLIRQAPARFEREFFKSSFGFAFFERKTRNFCFQFGFSGAASGAQRAIRGAAVSFTTRRQSSSALLVHLIWRRAGFSSTLPPAVILHVFCAPLV